MRFANAARARTHTHTHTFVAVIVVDVVVGVVVVVVVVEMQSGERGVDEGVESVAYLRGALAEFRAGPDSDGSTDKLWQASCVLQNRKARRCDGWARTLGVFVCV